MTHNFAIRVTLPYEQCAKAIAMWSMKCEKLIVYEHQGEKTEKIHIHIAIEGSIIAAKQLKNLFVDVCPGVGGNKGLYSSKQWDNDHTYITYMTKGQHDPKYNKGYPDDLINQLKQAWIRPTAYEKKNPNKEKLDKFYTWGFEQGANIQDIAEFYTLRPLAQRYVYATCGQVWDIQAMNVYRMLMRTVMYVNTIPVPESEKTWKW